MSFIEVSIDMLAKFGSKPKSLSIERAWQGKKGKSRAYKVLAVLGNITAGVLFIGVVLPLSIPIGMLECICPPDNNSVLN
jgi:hypothetical protein